MTIVHSTHRFLITVLIVLVAADCGGKRQSSDDEGDRASGPSIVPVQTSPVTVGDVIVAVSAIGKTEAIRKEKLFAPVAGKLISLRVLEGSSVNAGDVVAVILTKESQAALAGAEALLRSAATVQQKLEAERMMQLARSSESTVSVSAKFNGVVAARNVSEGELVSENEELLSLIDLSTVAFVADVSLRDVPRIHGGMRAVVRFPTLGANGLAARVDAILPQSDLQSQTVKVRLRFDDLSPEVHAQLRTDIAGTAQFIVGVHRNALTVPKSAVLRDDERNLYSLVIVTPDSLALRIPVTVGVSTDSTVEVMSHRLRKGMPVIVQGNYMLADSTKVSVNRRDEQ